MDNTKELKGYKRGIPNIENQSFKISAILFILVGALTIIFKVLFRHVYYPTLVSLIMIAIGGLMLYAKQNDKFLWISLILLFLFSGAINSYLFVALIFLGISYIGFNTNLSIGKKEFPLFNIISIVFCAISILTTLRVMIRLTGLNIDFFRLMIFIFQIIFIAGVIFLNISAENVVNVSTVRAFFNKIFEKIFEGKEKYGNNEGNTGKRTFSSIFYGNIGNKLKILAKIQGYFAFVIAILGIFFGILGFVLYLIFAIIRGVSIITAFLPLLSGVVAVLCALLLIVMSWPLYGFGQIVDDLHKVKETGLKTNVIEKQESVENTEKIEEDKNPDELPEI